MAFTVIQVGTGLKFIDTDGVITSLTLPTGVTLRDDVPPRWATYNGYVMLVNTPNTPLTIDAYGTVRPLCPKAPAVAPVVSAGSAGTLTGTYSGIRYTYLIKDAIGNVIAESDYSPASNSVSITNQKLQVTGVSTSAETSVNARRVYRPTTDGAVLFPWFDIEGNTITTAQDDLADAGLSLVAAPELGNPPHLTHIKEWRNLLWGASDDQRDTIYYTQPGIQYAWTESLVVPGTGRDTFGIRGLMPRREALGIGRRDIIWQVTGESADDFRLVKLSENTGVESQESMIVYRDTILWLWKDGVYQWDGEGIRNISDPNVSSWFNTDDYFNRDKFDDSFAVFDPNRYKYRLYLASADSETIDRWVEYDMNFKTWWGPHKTTAFTPACAFILSDANDKTQAIAGSSSGFIWQETATPTDNLVDGIEIDLDTRFLDGGTPDLEKYWGQLSVIGKAQAAGTLDITPTTGYLNSSAQAAISYDMTKGRQRLRRLGNGKLMQLNFQHSAAGEGVELYGFQLPFHILGRR